MRMTVTIEIREGQSAHFTRETDDIVSSDGTLLNAHQLRPLWTDLAGEVFHWIRYRQPTEAVNPDA